MNAAKFLITPYYEIMDSIMPLRRLFLDECASIDTNGRLRGRQLVEFKIRYDHCLLISESKRQGIESFNIRCIIRFCKVDECRCDEYGIRVKDAFPLHLTIDLNNNIISLPNLLPNDRFGKDGRRFPRPVDLTERLIDNSLITNRMHLSWVQDESRHDEYYFAMYLVRLRSCEELTSLLIGQQISSTNTTLRLVHDQCVNLNGTVDDDIMLVNTSINMSLNCPVSRSRMKIPIRGQQCNHLQCFDCMTYLVMNYKKPTWLCPVCDKKAFFCHVEVDGLILNILRDGRSKTVEQIQFNKSGRWRPMKKTPDDTNDDSQYYDITEYVNPTQFENNVKKSSLLLTNENMIDYKVDKYLNQILNLHKLYSNTPNIDVQMKMHHIKCGHNPPGMDVMSPSSLSSGMSPNISQQSGHLFQAQSSTLNKQCMDSIDNNTSLSQHPNNDQVQPSRVTMPLSTSEALPKVNISSIMSMMTRKRNSKDVIVISDDDEDNTKDHGIVSSSLLTRAKSQKRLFAVSSMPTDIVSSKQMKLSDNPKIQLSQSQFLPGLFKCSDPRNSSFYNESFPYVNKVFANTYPIVAAANNSNQADMVTSSTMLCHNAIRPMVNESVQSPTNPHDRATSLRSMTTTEFNQSFFNRCMLANVSRQIEFQTRHNSATVLANFGQPESLHSNRLSHSQPDKAPLPSNNPATPQDTLRAQWIQLIKNCPMPYVNQATTATNNNSPSTKITSTMSPSLRSCNSRPNVSNIFYSN